MKILDTAHHPRGPIRRSRSGPRRAAVLILVQLLIIAHVVQWWLTGRSISPIEPSEAMEFTKHGRINAGAIFFALAMLSTLVLGRWFCGWGCHLVLLQDGCAWLMKKCGVRPRPFRSRLLMYVPLGLALYMFLWPVVYRLAVAPWTNPGLIWPGFSIHLTTDHFWSTFPGLTLAVPFLLVCGCAMVYVLGSKGFCTYGCPYGGFFAPLDELSPARIRVSDACEQCGHCTAVCTSNVRVHEEVAAYGMVVDPGCMKCLDCVSVCPNEALSFGFGRPAVGVKKTAPPRPRDLTGRQEIVVTLVFCTVFFALRGDVARLPLLMAASVAGIMAALLFKAWRVLRDDVATMYGHRLKGAGRLRPAGIGFLGLIGVLLVLVFQSITVNVAAAIAGYHDRQVTVPLAVVFGEPAHVLPDQMTVSAQRAVTWYRRSASFTDGGVGLFTSGDTLVRLAWLHACLGELDDAIDAMTKTIERDDAPPQRFRDMAVLLDRAGRPEDSARFRELALLRATGRGSLSQ